MKKKLFVIFSIISVFFFNIDFVFAFELHSYDSSVTLFDKWGNDLPICRDDIYTYSQTNSTMISTDLYPTGTQVCSKNHSASLDRFKNVLPYHTRIDYTTYTGQTFSVMLATPQPLFITDGISNSDSSYYTGNLNMFYEWSNNSGTHTSTYLAGLIFIMAPSSCILTDVSNGNTYNCFGGYSSSGRQWNNIGISDNDIQGWTTDMINFHINYDLIMNSNLYTAKFVTNYDLIDFRNNVTKVNKTDSFEFNTDKTLNIKYEEYALLIPKHNQTFSSYLWTDSNFYYDISYFQSNSYDSQLGAGFDEISFGYLNGFNWFRWDFTFTTEQLSNNKVLRIFNHNEGRELNLKYFSSDFDVRLMNKDSSSYTYNGVTYTNAWSDLKNNSSMHVINNNYSVDMFNDFDSYTKSLPNLVKTFSSAFVFIGTLISNAFNLFSNEILTYFYVLFGLMLIMLLIMILK